ncbi:LysR family transcriptional regulator [Acidaminobacter sp. JC074]|uniref:LysR family transcriptional regulator n=1 Tax=Acidaminobacter sp. JC074 TaxID=2530199 RepID=UPI001F0DFC32|nr:LysR family transcriptional regulator [Acidaminobacter sp. JC074]
MDIRNYITFVHVVEMKGFTKAAEKLNYAQSTVTLHIKELEDHYKASLFDRLGKKIQLTHFGKLIYPEAKKVVYDYNKLINIDVSGQRQVLRIGVYESLLKYRLMPIFRMFKQANPHVDIVIAHGVCKDLRDMVRRGDLDLAFQLETLQSFKDLTAHKLCPESLSLIMPVGQAVNELYNGHQTIYLTEEGCSYRKLFETYLKDHQVNSRQVMETGSVDLIKQYVSLGMGYSLIPKIAINDDDKLEIYDIPFKPTIYTQLVHHKSKEGFQAFDDFIQLVKKQAVKW